MAKAKWLPGKHPGGRPRSLSPQRIKELQEKFSRYIDDNPIPVIAEFAYQNNVLRESLYDYSEFSTLLKKCSMKKEANLEKGALAGQINVAMAIFSLKQMGWSDKQEIKHEGFGAFVDKFNSTKDKV